MSLVSTHFLFLFLPCALAVYYLAGKRLREFVLLAFSILFYYFEPKRFLLLFLCTVAFTVLVGRLLARSKNERSRKLLFLFGLAFQLLPLLCCKYSAFFLGELGRLTGRAYTFGALALPLGISFYTFKGISYLADLYGRRAVPEGSPLHDALYLSFFPQLQCGPLSRYDALRLSDRFEAGRFAFFSGGVRRFLVGFCKKVLLADVLFNLVEEVFSAPFSSFSCSYAWLGSLCYSLQLYYDFSGYSDMAIGLTRMFGYDCCENFDYPYLTDSVSHFWRRWHISLSQWFRDYVYIPMGGSRSESRSRVYFNLLTVWLLTGLWHGANWTFLFWGLGYFVLISFERLTGLPGRLKRGWARAAWRVGSLLFINLQWIVFRSPSLSFAFSYIRRLFRCAANPLADSRVLFLLREYRVFLIGALLLCFPLGERLRRLCAKDRRTQYAFEIVSALVIALLFLWALSYVFAGQNNPFAYANF